MDEQQLTERVADALLLRRGINWTPEAGFYEQMKQAAAGALALLRGHAGDSTLSLESPEDFDLAVTCAWYLAENRRAEFLREYGPDLISLRIREVLKSGSGENTDVS